MKALRVAGQALFWTATMLLVVAFAHWPPVTPLPPGHGELKLSMAHLTERLSPCRQLSEDERAALPPNMRVFEICERERAPARLEILLDGEPIFVESVRPAGSHRDGRAYLHRTWPLPAGDYTLELRLRDTPREQGFDKQARFALSLQPGVSALLRVGDGEPHLHPGTPLAKP
jgi:hypothetical protein